MMLGDRIRKLRKEKKLTLEALAGEGLTKGMLSLIENNKANPSMESLTFIAERLSVDVSELLEEVSSQELREILEQAEKLYNQENLDNKYQLLIELVRPYINKLTHGYESARLLDIYSRCLYKGKMDGWQEFSNQAATMYDKMNLTANRAGITIFHATVKFIDHAYTQALDVLTKERAEIEANHAYIDPMTRVDLDYHEAIFHFAIGDYDSATYVMENAIHFSKENRIFYRIDDLYRLAAGQALLSRDVVKKELYLTKLRQYGEFADDLASILVHDLMTAMAFNSEDNNYSKALEIIDNYIANPKLEDKLEGLYLVEKGKSLYGLRRFNEALLNFNKVETPSTTHHPFDLSLFYIKDSYKALCHLELGAMGDALQFAKLAVDNFESLPHTLFKDFAFETYDRIKEKIG
ncbi:MAG: transcriptional regulator [Neobacillus sp.]|jgi:transcriptional regulator with XRE-family HTH domain|nr:transcriptional regulator [Neobacillus sp.]